MEQKPPKTNSVRSFKIEEPRNENLQAPSNLNRRRGNDAGKTVAPGGLPLDISQHLKPPMLPNVNPDAITYDEAHAGVTVHIPGAPQMRCEDVILFYWGMHKSESSLYQDATDNSIVRVLCITYNFLPHAQYGVVDLYYEVQRCGIIIGRSPTLRVTVNYAAPVTPKQRQRKRSVNRRYPGS